MIKNKTKSEYNILFFHIFTFFDPMLPNKISEGSGAAVIIIFDFDP
jgi:hypothetical protein